MTAMWTDTRDGESDDVTADKPAQRLRANREIRRRPIDEHGGYAGTDPITGRVLCAICRRSQNGTEAAPS